MKKSNKKGFTIVELVIVIAVIGILATVLIPTFSSIVNKAQANAAMQEARNALTIALADQKDAALGNATVITVDNYVFTYNGQLTVATASSIPTNGYKSTDANGVTVYISSADYNQLATGAATYTAVSNG